MSIDPHLLVEQVAELQEQRLRQLLPDNYERVFRSVSLRIAEWTRTEEEQIWAMMVFAGRCSTREDGLSLSIALIWFARKSFRAEPAQVLLEGIGALPIGQFLMQARQVAREVNYS